MTSHGWKVPDMAIFTPVQTTMMAASPVQSCCPLLSRIGPLEPMIEFSTPLMKPCMLSSCPGGILVGTLGSIWICIVFHFFLWTGLAHCWLLVC